MKNLKTNITVLLMLLVSTLSIAFAQKQSLLPEQQHLSYIQGKWTVEGSDSTYLEVCDWIQGNHLQCISISKEKEGIDSSISYLTYSATEKAYIYYGIYGSGNTRTLRGKWEIDKFIFEGQRVTNEKTVKWRVTMKPVNRNLDFLEEKSIDGGEWNESSKFQYKRVQ